MFHSLDGKRRNMVFFTVVAIAAGVLLLVNIMANRQDQAFQDNYDRYREATQLLGEQNYQQAWQVFKSLDADSQASYQVQYMAGYCAFQAGDYAEAERLLRAARETRPALLQDQKYLLRYGLFLYQMGDYPQARLYLQESLKYADDAGAAAEAQDHLAAIDQKAMEVDRP